MNVSNTISRGERKSSSAKRRGKKKKNSARELSFLVDRTTIATEKVAVKIITMMASN